MTEITGSEESLKILLIDIETAPNLGWTWGKWEQNVIQFERETFMLSFTAKWLHSSKFITYGLSDFPDYDKDKQSDKELCRKLWDLLDEADVVIAHNGDSFDIKKTNARFIVNGLGPPSPYRTIDTKKVAKKYFSFNSNSLNDLGELFSLGHKAPTGGFKLWLDCMEGKKEAWKKMKQYNKQDVALLEKIYLKLRAWIKNHPNIGVNNSKHSCHACGSSNVQKRGYTYCRMSKYQRIHCKDCGSWSQGQIEKISYGE